MSFDSIIGQDKIKSALTESINRDRVGHAYILCGPEGIGKRTLARHFAGMLLCSSFKHGEICGIRYSKTEII